VLSATHIRLPGASLAHEIASRLLCAARLDTACEYEPELTAAYGPEVAKLVREHVPSLAFEEGSRAIPVDFRGCRLSSCGNGPSAGGLSHSVSGSRATMFVHVVDRRPDGALYIQYWLYYADSATLRGVPVAGPRGYHADDWESYQVRIGPKGSDARASSHHGYNYSSGPGNWGSDAGIGPLRKAAELTGLRNAGGWGPETGLEIVSGGSHAGAVKGRVVSDRGVRPGDIRLVPLEPIASRGRGYRFAVSSPWDKAVWSDPESGQT
jgi:hypothetical protein